MSLYKDPRSTLLGLVEKENGLTLNPVDYDFTNPTAATPPEGSTASYNTRVTLSANTPAAPYVGSVEIFYNRLDLADVGRLAAVYLQSPNIDSTHGAIDSLNRRYGLNFKPEDLIDQPAVINGDYNTITLEATAESLGWFGTLDINVTEGDLLLENYVTESMLGGLNYPTESTDRTFAHFYSYWRDFSDHHDTLKLIKETDAVGLSLISILSDVTGDNWTGGGPSPYSLKDAVIVYSGSTEGRPNTNMDYPMVLVIRLDPTQCTELDGDLVIHHSDDIYASLGI